MGGEEEGRVKVEVWKERAKAWRSFGKAAR